MIFIICGRSFTCNLHECMGIEVKRINILVLRWYEYAINLWWTALILTEFENKDSDLKYIWPKLLIKKPSKYWSIWIFMFRKFLQILPQNSFVIKISLKSNIGLGTRLIVHYFVFIISDFSNDQMSIGIIFPDLRENNSVMWCSEIMLSINLRASLNIFSLDQKRWKLPFLCFPTYCSKHTSYSYSILLLLPPQKGQNLKKIKIELSNLLVVFTFIRWYPFCEILLIMGSCFRPCP